MNEFRKAKDIIAGVEAARKRAERELSRKCDWDDPSDVALLKREERSEERNAALPDNRVCPVCNQHRPMSRQWVVNKRNDFAVCRTCFMSSATGEKITLPFSVFETEPRYRLDGAMLCQARERVKLSKSEFARRAGWTRQQQSKLETGDVRTVTDDTADVILTVLREAGGTTMDCL